MSCEFDLHYQAIAAKERHAALLAESLRHQQLKQMLGSQGQRHSAWQWFRQTILHHYTHG